MRSEGVFPPKKLGSTNNSAALRQRKLLNQLCYKPFDALTGYCGTLQRQILLSKFISFIKDDLYHGGEMADAIAQRSPSTQCFEFCAPKDWRLSSCESLHHFLQAMWDFLIDRTCGYFNDLLAEFGIAFETFFRTGTMIVLFHLLRLLAFAARLKGGSMSCDPLIVARRSITAWTPWTMLCEIRGFSPRLASSSDSKRHRRSTRKFGLSRDLWIFILLLSSLCQGVNAGGGNQYNVDCTGFRSDRRSRKMRSMVYNLKSACRNVDSPITPPDDPPSGDPSPDEEDDDDWDFETDSYLFQMFGIGCLPQYLVAAFLPDIALQDAIEQITIDSAIPLNGEDGVFIPARGVPLWDSVILLWQPAWLLNSGNCLLLIDASLLGRNSFVILYSEREVTYQGLYEHLRPLWEDELDHVHAFAPYFSRDPMGEDTSFPAVHGLTIALLQRDVFPPACIPEPEEAFREYKLWGADMQDADQPPTDNPWPVDKVQMTISGDTRLYSIGSYEPSQTVLWSLARRFTSGESELHVQTVRNIPQRYVWYGEPVAQMASVHEREPPSGSVCVFLILRGIGREGQSAWITQDELSRFGILQAVGLAINEIPGFKIQVTGGRWERGRITCRHGDLLFFNFISSDSDPGEDDEDDDDTIWSDDGVDDVSPRDDASVHAQTSANRSGDQIVWNSQREGSANERADTRLVDTWSPDFKVTNADQAGNREDTSAGNRDVCSGNPGGSVGCQCSPAQRWRHRPAHVTSGMLLDLAGIALIQSFVGGGSVILPCIDFNEVVQHATQMAVRSTLVILLSGETWHMGGKAMKTPPALRGQTHCADLMTQHIVLEGKSGETA